MTRYWQGIWQGPLTRSQYAEIERMVARSGYERQAAEYELRTWVEALAPLAEAMRRDVEKGAGQ